MFYQNRTLYLIKVQRSAQWLQDNYTDIKTSLIFKFHHDLKKKDKNNFSVPGRYFLLPDCPRALQAFPDAF